ncbi:GDP-L-fucose synthase family protein [Candidatus Pelagibacter sp.]|uniref:GDP-L-fucose synthase family protein n=1 Tax=Candidatus Pelagibacter sp. TaxID=2024849 RepID=UPI003D0BA7E6
MRKTSKIYVAGHRGLVGSAIVNSLKKKGFSKIILRTRSQLDLTKQIKVNNFFKKNKPEIVIIAAAKVGGIYANNKYQANFIYENLMIQNNLINSSFENKVKKVIFLGSSCIYPKYSKQPIKEDYLLSGELEKTNISYAVAKISGLVMCNSYNMQYNYRTDFRCLMPTNLYGPGDNYHGLNSHVIPALIKRFHNAKIKKKKSIKVWGNGLAKREFLFSEDLAEAVILILKLSKQRYKKILSNNINHINIGSGQEYTIKNLAKIISNIVGFKGKIEFDKSKPNGTMRKFLCNRIMKKIGWGPSVKLKDGIIKTYEEFKKINS